ncbi:MAG: hypothetical protein VZQ61_07010 [Christensenellaceae bacterium]
MSGLLYKDKIQLIEKNIRGAWVIYGAAGVRQYYGYMQAEAKRRYLEECERILENKNE